jgi:uncharacterized protein (DUF58 family)
MTSSRFLRPQDLKKYRNLLFAAKIVVEGFYAGRHRSPYHDFSAEFADYRSYVPGDEIRAVDWKAVARTDKLYVKLFRKETDMSAYIFVDSSASMAFAGYAGVTKLEFSSYLAASLSYLMVRQGDRPGLALCSDTVKDYLPPAGTMKHLGSLALTLERTVSAGGTGMAKCLENLFPIAKRRGMVIVISDLLEEPEPLYRALGMFRKRGFEVLLLHVLTDEEMSLPEDGPAKFIDPEGSGSLNLDPSTIRAVYNDELQAHLDELVAGAKARGIRYQLCRTSEPYDQALSTYLSSRGG